MRKFLLVTSGVVVCLFTVMFCMTFFARDMVEDKARDFVAKKTAHYTEKGVSMAEEVLQSPLTKKLLSEEQYAAFSAEIEDYRTDPIGFVKRLCASKKPAFPADGGHFSKFRKKILGWKESLRNHYNETLDELIFDMRIFTGSNIVAGILGLLLARLSRGREGKELIVYPCLLIVSIGIGVYYYIDSMSFFTILFKNYMGWGYPILLLGTFAYLRVKYADIGSVVSPAKEG